MSSPQSSSVTLESGGSQPLGHNPFGDHTSGGSVDPSPSVLSGPRKETASSSIQFSRLDILPQHGILFACIIRWPLSS